MKLGALDVGTNTVLMLVVECEAGGTPRPLADLSRITRLGRGIDGSGRLDPAAAALTLDTIVEFVAKARAMGAGRILTAATSALRDAQDGAGFIAEVKSRAGIDLEVISGETEAELSYLAVARGLSLDPKQSALIVDIGGGSTELIRAEPGRPLELASLQIGSVRLTERVIKNDPPKMAEAAELRVGIDAELLGLKWDFKPDVMVGIAGTVTTVCAVAMKLKTYDPALVHGHRLSRTEVEGVIHLLASLPLEQRKKLPGMIPGRADVILAGAAILERVMSEFEAETVIVSDQGVRWGLIWRELESQAQARAPQPS